MKNSLLNRIFHSELIKNTSLLISGNVLGQAIAFLMMTVLSRIYTKEDFGVFALFMSFSTILSLLASGKYYEAFVVTKDRKEASLLMAVTLRLLIVFSVFLFLFLLFFRKPFFSLLRMDSLTGYWWLIPLSVITLVLQSTFSSAATREKYYKAIAQSSFSLNAFGAVFKWLYHYVLPNTFGLLWGQITGQLISSLSYRKLWPMVKDSFKCRWDEVRKTAIHYQDQPRYSMPRNLMNSISANLPFLILTGVFGEARLGLFYMAFNMSSRPIQLLVGSLYQVIFEKTTSLQRARQKITPIIRTYRKQNVLFVLPAFILIFIFAPQLFGFFFGEEWKVSGEYLRYILPWQYLILFNSPLGFLPLLFKKQHFYMWMEAVYLVLRFAVIFVGIYLNDFEQTILLYGLLGFAYLSFTICWYNSLIRGYERQLNREP